MVAHEKNVNIEKTAVENIYAENVKATKIGVNSIQAGSVEIDYSGVGFLRGQNVTQTNCGNAIIHAKNLKTNDVKSLVTIADRIDGNVTTVLDKKGAAVFGLVAGAVVVFFGILRRLTR